MAEVALTLDTHALLWWFGDRDNLSPRAASAINDADEILINPITFWEVAMLAEKGRIELDRPSQRWATAVEAIHRITVVELSPRVCVAAAQLVDFHGDPADRLIVAGAAAFGSPLVSRDAAITQWADTHQLEVVW